MAKLVRSKTTGVISDVADNHWTLTSNDFDVIEEKPKEEPKKPEPKAKKE